MLSFSSCESFKTCANIISTIRQLTLGSVLLPSTHPTFEQNWGSYAVGALTEDYAVTYINRACSNGVTRDLYEPRNDQLGSITSWSFWLWGLDCSQHNFDDAYYTLGFFIGTGLTGYTYTCNGWVRPQLDSIGSDVDIVLLTFGGNDAGFSKIVMECFVLTPERDACACSEKVEEAYRWMDERAEDVYMKLFRDLHGKMRQGSRVIVSSYPYLTLADNDEKLGVSASYGAEFEDKCGDGTTQKMNAAREMRNMVKTFAAKVGGFAEKANADFGEKFIRFVDVTYKFDGHGLFGYGGVASLPFYASISPTSEIYAYEDSDDCYLYDIISTFTMAEWWHPKGPGQSRWGQAIFPYVIDAAYEAVPRGRRGDIGSDQDPRDEDDVYALDVAIVLPGKSVADAILEGSTTGLEALGNVTSNYRFGVVTSGGEIVQNLTSSSDDLVSSLELGGQELDTIAAEDGLRNVTRALNNLNWFQSGVTSIVLFFIGSDADYDSVGLENTTEFLGEASDRSLMVFVIDMGSVHSSAFGQRVANTSSGLYIKTNNITNAMGQAIEDALTRPIAVLSEGYTSLIDEEVVFDAEGTFDPNGAAIKEYEWTFPGDNRIMSTEPKTSWSFGSNYEGMVYLRVTNVNDKVGIAAAKVKIGSDESEIDQQETGDCPIDANGESVIFLNGVFQNCHATSFPFPRANSTEKQEALLPGQCAGRVLNDCKCIEGNGRCHSETIQSVCHIDATDLRNFRNYKKNVIDIWKKQCEKWAGKSDKRVGKSKKQAGKSSKKRAGKKNNGQDDAGDVNSLLRNRNVFTHHQGEDGM